MANAGSHLDFKPGELLVRIHVHSPADPVRSAQFVSLRPVDKTLFMPEHGESHPDGPEERLLGGRLTVVVRVGDTVRRPGKPWSSEVQRLLHHVRERGFLQAPEPFGFDERGREILSYIEGDTSDTVDPWPGTLWSDGLLADVGRTAAAFHRAVADFVPSDSPHWQFQPRDLRPGEIICHNDFAHYNAVFQGDHLRGVIDWDCAGPGTIEEEMAFLAWQWVPLGPPEWKANLGCDPNSDNAARLRLLLDSYGYKQREGFLDAVIRRIESSRSRIEASAAAGDPAFVALVETGYTRNMSHLIDYVTEIGPRLQATIE